MNVDRFTIKTQEAVQAAVALAARHRNPQATAEHLLLALLDQENGAVLPVLRKVGADPDAIRTAAARAVAGQPTMGDGACGKA